MTDTSATDHPHHGEPVAEGSVDPRELWAQFLTQWPAQRLRTMTLEEYTNDHREDALVYWLEVKLSALGSILGGSAFKFGIARRSATAKPKRSAQGRRYNKQYLWQAKLGQTPQEAFENTRQVLLNTIDAARAGRLEVIDKLPLGSTVRWKIAFLYQNQEDAVIFPIFKKATLWHHYKQQADPKAKERSTPLSLMYKRLSASMEGLDVFERANQLWTGWEHSQGKGPRDWLVPLGGLDAGLIDTLRVAQEVHSKDLPDTLEPTLLRHEIKPGDRLALHVPGAVLARGLVQSWSAGQIHWRQLPGQIELLLEQNPSEVTEITSWRLREAVWGEGAQNVQHKDAPQDFSPCAPAVNQILYGPPGTGKTYHITRQALALCGVDTTKMSPKEVAEALQGLQRAGRVEIVTFHPSYGYEDFVEGIRPVLGERDDLGYRCVDGALKSIALRAAAEGLQSYSAPNHFASLWEAFLGHLDSSEDDYLVEGIDTGLYALERGRGGRLEARRVLSVEKEEAWVASHTLILSREVVAALWAAREHLPEDKTPSAQMIKDLVLRIRGHSRSVHPEILWPVFKELRQLARGQARQEDAPAALRYQVLRALREGKALHFHEGCRAYVLIVDEINRGNLGKVLGELITLLEPSRRLDASDAMVVRLPVSQEPFGVPPNLHILGTMNTADRSIALLDAALRRRFTFQEMMPDANLLREELVRRGAMRDFATLMQRLLETLNERIAFLYDREHQIGHAYFLGATDPLKACHILAQSVLPLLQEYFYEAWDRICLVLGCPYDEGGHPLRDAPHCLGRGGRSYRAPALEVKVQGERDVLGIDRGDFEARQRYQTADWLLSPARHPEKLVEGIQGMLMAPMKLAFEDDDELPEI